MKAMTDEIRFALRSLRNSLGFSALTITILGVGLATTIFMFGAIKGYILSPLPFQEPERLLHVERNLLARGFNSLEIPQVELLDWQERQSSFEGLAGFYSGTVNITGNDRPERYDGAFITGNAFRMLRVQPVLGRTLMDADSELNAPPVVLIGYDIWRLRFNADPDIIGTTVRVNAQEMEIVGVMPESFKFPLNEDIWVPLKIDPADLENRDSGTTLEVFGRLNAGVTPQQAHADLQSIAEALGEEYPATNEGYGAVVKPYTEEYISDDLKQTLWILFVFAWLVLLIAAANAANLVLARAVRRRRELAIRSAIGASRARIIASVLTETLVIASLAAMLALFLAYWAGEWIDRVLIENDQAPQFWVDMSMDGMVIGYTVAAAFVTALLAGLVPALKASHVDLNTQLKDGGGAGGSVSTMSKVLVVAEITLSCVLLVSAATFTSSVMQLESVEVGATTEDILVGRIGLMEGDYPTEESHAQFWQEAQRRMAADPAVISATAASALPGNYGYGSTYTIEGRELGEDERLPLMNWSPALPSFFETFEIELASGRLFTEADTADSLPVAVIDRDASERMWPGEDPLGKRFKFGGAQSNNEYMTVVGVVEDFIIGDVDNQRRPEVVMPMAQNPQRFAFLVARTRGEPEAFTRGFREVVLGLDSDIPVYWLETLESRMEKGLFGHRITTQLTGIMAVVAMLLAAGGMYAVLAYSVGQRTREIGVRRALGAADRGIVTMVARQAGIQLAIGLSIGLLLSIGASFVTRSVTWGAEGFDILAFMAVAAMLIGVTAAASLLPTRRALKVHPMTALRYE